MLYRCCCYCVLSCLILTYNQESRCGQPRGYLYLPCLSAKQMAVWNEALVLKILVHFVWSPNTEFNLWQTVPSYFSQADIKTSQRCLAGTCGNFVFAISHLLSRTFRNLNEFMCISCKSLELQWHAKECVQLYLIPFFSCKVRGVRGPTVGEYEIVCPK